LASLVSFPGPHQRQGLAVDRLAHRGSLLIISEGQVCELGRQCAIKHPISTSGPYPARSLFLPTILHADAVLIVAGIPRMIFQARLLILTA